MIPTVPNSGDRLTARWLQQLRDLLLTGLVRGDGKTVKVSNVSGSYMVSALPERGKKSSAVEPILPNFYTTINKVGDVVTATITAGQVVIGGMDVAVPETSVVLPALPTELYLDIDVVARTVVIKPGLREPNSKDRIFVRRASIGLAADGSPMVTPYHGNIIELGRLL